MQMQEVSQTKIAIVGSSRLSETEEMDARKFSGLVLNQMIKECGKDDLIFISGGAKGVDSLAEEVAIGLGIKTEIHKPTEENWDAYKVRNIRIAEECDVLYCFPTKIKLVPCYHCQYKDHEKTAGCWTMNYAEKLKKETHIVPLI